MQKILDETELKTVLDKKGFRFGDRFPSSAFVITFIDSATQALLTSNIFKTPIDGIANLPEVCKVTHRKADQVSIILDFGFDYNSRKVCDFNIELDKFIYFDKPSDKADESDS